MYEGRVSRNLGQNINIWEKNWKLPVWSGMNLAIRRSLKNRNLRGLGLKRLLKYHGRFFSKKFYIFKERVSSQFSLRIDYRSDHIVNLSSYRTAIKFWNYCFHGTRLFACFFVGDNTYKKFGALSRRRRIILHFSKLGCMLRNSIAHLVDDAPAVQSGSHR